MSKFNNEGSIAIGSLERPCIQIIDPVTKEKVAKCDILAWHSTNPYVLKYSSDGSYIVMGCSTAPYLFAADITGDYFVSETIASPGYYIQDIAWHEGSNLMLCAMSSGDDIAIYDTTGFSWVKQANPTVLPGQPTYTCALNPAGTIAALGFNISPHMILYDTSDWSVITNPTTIPTFDVKSMDFNPAGTKLACGIQAGTYLSIYTVSGWTLDTAPAEPPTAIVYDVKYSPDGNRLVALQGTSTTNPIVYDTSDMTRETVPTLDRLGYYNTVGNWHEAEWLSNDVFVASNVGTPSMIYYDLANQTATMDYTTFGVLAIAIYRTTHYEVSGTVSETLTMANWIVTVTDINTATTVAVKEFTGTAFTVGVPSADPVTVTISAKQGVPWAASLAGVLVDDLVYPTTPNSTAYYYKCTVAGTTGATEPTWPITENGTVNDGSVTWQRVERLIQPVTQSPIIPTVIT